MFGCRCVEAIVSVIVEWGQVILLHSSVACEEDGEISAARFYNYLLPLSLFLLQLLNTMGNATLLLSTMHHAGYSYF